jgi:hypothetical protein
MAVRLGAVNPLRCRIAGAATSSSCVRGGSRTTVKVPRNVAGQRMQVAHQTRSPLRVEVLCRLQKSVAARDERAHHAQLSRTKWGVGAWRKWRGRKSESPVKVGRSIGEADWLDIFHVRFNTTLLCVKLSHTLHTTVHTISTASVAAVAQYGPSGMRHSPIRICRLSVRLIACFVVSRTAVTRHDSRSIGCRNQVTESTKPRTRILLDTRRILDTFKHIPQGLRKVSA